MGLPARQRRLEADAEKRPHVARLAEEERRAEQQPDLHAVRVAELEAREHRERAPRRSLRKRGTRSRCSRASRDRKSTRLNSSHGSISYAVLCLRRTQNNIRQQ